MFEYTHEVVNLPDNFSFGVFPNKSIAEMLKRELERNFPSKCFVVKQIV